MKDNFSIQASEYASYRPGYPAELFELIRRLVHSRQHCWDCGTGNGQLAGGMTEHFETVYGTDISKRQIAHAIQADNIRYSIQPAEQTGFPDDHFDLVTVGQAIHWFDFERFYAEVRRTTREHALLFVAGYGLTQIDSKVDAVVRYLYEDIVGPYWDAERRYIEEEYRTIPFPFREIDAPKLSSRYDWTIDQMTGYLRTWSAVQHYLGKERNDPVTLIEDDLKHAWGSDTSKPVMFPLLLRIGRVHG